MWYLKTKLGLFWIVESDEPMASPQYTLGMDDDSLGFYQSVEAAIQDVCDHKTGAIKWDASLRADAPHDVSGWVQGQPESWN